MVQKMVLVAEAQVSMLDGFDSYLKANNRIESTRKRHLYCLRKFLKVAGGDFSFENATGAKLNFTQVYITNIGNGTAQYLSIYGIMRGHIVSTQFMQEQVPFNVRLNGTKPYGSSFELDNVGPLWPGSQISFEINATGLAGLSLIRIETDSKYTLLNTSNYYVRPFYTGPNLSGTCA